MVVVWGVLTVVGGNLGCCAESVVAGLGPCSVFGGSLEEDGSAAVAARCRVDVDAELAVGVW